MPSRKSSHLLILLLAVVIPFVIFYLIFKWRPLDPPAPEEIHIEAIRPELIRLVNAGPYATTGARAVADVALLLGIPFSLPDFLAICPATDAGIEKDDLTAAADRAKIPLRAVSLDWPSLLDQPKPVILILPGNQYAVADPRDAQPPAIPVYYGPKARYLLNADQLGQIWNGDALIPEPPDPLPAFQSPRIRFDRLIYDFGDQAGRDNVSQSFRFKNSGDQPLEILNVVKSCSCSRAAASKLLVEPGGEASIDLHLDLSGRHGEQRVHVVVETNDPENASVTLAFHGYDPPPIDPAALAQSTDSSTTETEAPFPR